MKILIIGSGGREHAIAKSCMKSSLVSKVYVAPGNDGMRSDASIININNIKEFVKFAKFAKIDLTIVGSENYLEDGIVDVFTKENLKIFGPNSNAVKIETSKEYAKMLMKRCNIPTASYEVFNSFSECKKYLRDCTFPIVLKYDGIASGKGVVICNSYDESIKQSKMFLEEKKYGDASLLVEEYLEGVEFTLMALVHNNLISFMDVSQDYKRAFDNDQGLNTGGMGVCSPITTITEKQLQYAKDIMETVVECMYLDNNSFTGFLYGGFMTSNSCVNVIEFNARFGDPEAQVLLHRLESDLVSSILSILDNKEPVLKWSNKFSVGVVMASNGYPTSYETGYKINNIPDDTIHMGTKFSDGYYTNGGRVLLVLGDGLSIEEARKNAYNKISMVSCENLFYRSDIGSNS